MMQKSKVEMMSHFLDRRDDEAGGLRRLTAVLFATLATVALVLGLGFAGPFERQAHAQNAVCYDETSVETLQVTSSTQYGSPAARRLVVTGLNKGDRVSKLEITNSNRNFGQSRNYSTIFKNSAGELEHLNNSSGVSVTSIQGLGTRTITYSFPESVIAADDGGFDVVVPISENTASSFQVKATVTRKVCEEPEPTTTPGSSAPEQTSPVEPEPRPTSEEPTQTAEQPAPSDNPATGQSEPVETSSTSIPASTGQTSEVAQPAPAGKTDVCSTDDSLLSTAKIAVNNQPTSEYPNFREITVQVDKPMRLDAITIGLRNTNNEFYYPTNLAPSNIRFVVEDSQGRRTFTAPADMTWDGEFYLDRSLMRTKEITLDLFQLIDLERGSKVIVSFNAATDGGKATELKPENVTLSATGVTCTDKEGKYVMPEGKRAEPETPVSGNPSTPIEQSVDGGDPNFATIRVYARAFNQYVDGPKSNATDSKDLRFTEGATFQLYGGKNRNSTDDGPGVKITAGSDDVVTCTIGKQGYCDMRLRVSSGTKPTQWDGKRVWVKQTKAADGAYFENVIKTGNYQSPKTDTWTIGYTPELRGGKIYYPSATGTSETKSFGAAVQALNNPKLPATCNPGPKIGFVMDLSGSISTEEREIYQDALTGQGGVIDQLSGTNASISAFTFSWGSPSDGNMGIGNHPGLVNVDTQREQAKAILNDRLSRQGGHTNWNQGLEAAYNAGNKYDIVVFITDGNPNTTGDAKFGPAGATVSLRALEGGVYAANNLKAEGTRVVAVAAGSENQNTPSNLKLISGPKENEDYFDGRWGDLAGNLSSVVRAVSCQSNVSVTKMIEYSDGTRAPGNGWNFEAAVSGATNVETSELQLVNSSNRAKDSVKRGGSVPDVTDAKGYAIWGLNFNTDNQAARASIRLKETPQTGFSFKEANCTQFSLKDGKKTPTGRTASFSAQNNPGEVTLDGSNQLGVRQQWDCEFVNAVEEKPQVNVRKTVESATQLSDGTWDVKYKVTVSNDGKAKTTYSLSDQLRYGDGINPISASFTRPDKTTGKWTDLTNSQSLTENRPIEANAKDTYSVEVNAELTAGSQAPQGMACPISNGVAERGGFLNTVRLTRADNSVEERSACDEPALPEIEKTGIDSVTGPDGDGLFTAKYSVTVRNRSYVNHAAGKPVYYTLTDTPQFAAGAEVKSWELSGVQFNDANSSQKTKLEGFDKSGTEIPINVVSEAKQLQPGANDQFTIAVKFARGTAQSDESRCNGNPEHGLYNGARVSSGKQYREDSACHEVPDQPTFKIGVEKWGVDNGKAVNLGDPKGSYGFALTGPDGKPTPLTQFVYTDRGGYVSSGTYVQVGQRYTLTEVKAPQGYALLAEPVVFRVVQEQGKYILRIESGASTNVKVVPNELDGSQNLRLIEVADVRQGNLPRTGGVGVWWPVFGGLLLVVAGGIGARRRAA